jgi:hypothetical protein
MGSLQQASAPEGSQRNLKAIEDLIGKLLLNLKTARKYLHQSRHRGKARDPPRGEVGQRCVPRKRKQVVTADGNETDVPDDDHGTRGRLGEWLETRALPGLVS